MIFPLTPPVEPPNPDMPDGALQDYKEAMSILSSSPRGAAALLRLAIQKLCIHFGGKGKDLNSDIAMMVKKGLPQKVQQALDAVRVIGNNAVHPGQMDTNDVKIASQLFPLVNLIVEHLISMPARVNAVYESLPRTALDQINQRDKRSSETEMDG